MDGSESAHIAAPAPARRVTGRRLAIVGAVWIALAGSALGIAALLDDEPARPRVSVAPQGLPLLRLYLDRDLPAEVLALPDAASQVRRLQELAQTTGAPARWVELGTAAQRLGDLEAADASFARALELEPDLLEARIGRLMADGATGSDGLARAGEALDRIVRNNPTSQVAIFNRAMVAVYASEREAAAELFARARALDARSPLGILAGRFGGAAGSSVNP